MADEKIYTNIGHVTAYAYAKSKGYTGTEEQFATDQANFAANAQQVREDKESVEATVATFGNTTVPAAVQTVTAEGTRQVGIVGTAGDTQVARVQAEGTTQKNAVQAKGDEVIASIPSDYTELTEEVNDLKSAVTQLDETLSMQTVLTTNDAILKLRKVTGDGNIREDSDGTRIRVVFDCNSVPADFEILCTYCSFYVGEWQSITEALVSSVSYGLIEEFTHTYVTSTVTGKINTIGYLCVSIKKDDNSAFTDEEKSAAIAALTVNIKCQSANNVIDDIEQHIIAEDKKLSKLYIGELSNGRLVANGTIQDSYAPYRLSTSEVVAFPTRARKFTVKLADTYLVAMRTGIVANNLSDNLYWFKNGDVITVNDTHNYYGISICRDYNPSAYIAVELSQHDVDKLGLELYYDDSGNSENYEAEKLLNATRLKFSNSAPNDLTTIPLIAHTSDCHGDYARVKNFINFCDRIGVDAAAITGDIVGYNPPNGLSWFKGIINNAKSLCAVCIGNHDVYDSSMSDASAYNFVFDGIADKIGNATGKTWYYKDITAKKIRIISINLYEYGGTTRNYTHFTSEQINWVCSTLNSTPENYGVVLLYHAPQIGLANAKSETYPKFFQDVRKYNNIFSGVTGSPINDIIDAFIGRTTISQTYTQTGTPSSVSVSADFTNVPSSVEFIAHLTGHFHQDTVCYVPNTTHLQLMLNVVCTNSLYGQTTYPYLCDLTDLPRNSSDSTQDAFNVYAIDRTNKVVKITRIGSNTTYEMDERKYMSIPYAL